MAHCRIVIARWLDPGAGVGCLLSACAQSTTTQVIGRNDRKDTIAIKVVSGQSEPGSTGGWGMRQPWMRPHASAHSASPPATRVPQDAGAADEAAPAAASAAGAPVAAGGASEPAADADGEARREGAAEAKDEDGEAREKEAAPAAGESGEQGGAGAPGAGAAAAPPAPTPPAAASAYSSASSARSRRRTRRSSSWPPRSRARTRRPHRCSWRSSTTTSSTSARACPASRPRCCRRASPVAQPARPLPAPASPMSDWTTVKPLCGLRRSHLRNCQAPRLPGPPHRVAGACAPRRARRAHGPPQRAPPQPARLARARVLRRAEPAGASGHQVASRHPSGNCCPGAICFMQLPAYRGVC